MSSGRKLSDSKDYFTYSSLDGDTRRDSWRQRGSFSFSSNNYESDNWLKSSYFTYSQPQQNGSYYNNNVSVKKNSVNQDISNKRRETFSDTRSIRSMDEKDYGYNSITLSPDLFGDASQIIPGLYLSGLKAVTPQKLRKIGITLLVSVIRDGSINIRAPSGVESVLISVDDCESADLGRYFPSILPFIHCHMPSFSSPSNSSLTSAATAATTSSNETTTGAVLVHCVAGISRSATVVIAYLMRYHNMSLISAYNLVKSRRSCIQPNASFWKQLVKYEAALSGINSTMNSDNNSIS